MSKKLFKLADTVRMAARSYDHGQRETGIKLISIVASKLASAEESRQLWSMVHQDLKTSGIRPYFHSIVLGAGGTCVRIG